MIRTFLSTWLLSCCILYASQSSLAAANPFKRTFGIQECKSGEPVGKVNVWNDVSRVYFEIALNGNGEVKLAKLFLGTKGECHNRSFTIHHPSRESSTFQFSIPRCGSKNGKKAGRFRTLSMAAGDEFHATLRVLVKTPALDTKSQGKGKVPSQARTSWAASCFKFTILPSLNLPETEIGYRVELGNASYLDSTVSGVPPFAGLHLENATYLGWCVDIGHFIFPGVDYTSRVYSTLDELPAHLSNPNWNFANYVLNHKQGTPADVQEALWCLVAGGIEPVSPEGQAMVLEAQALGGKFVPREGHIAAVLVDSGPDVQLTILEVRVEEAGCGE
jgi:hypothetical protein